MLDISDAARSNRTIFQLKAVENARNTLMEMHIR